MVWPRSSGMKGLAVPGSVPRQREARSADRCRDVQNPAVMTQAPLPQATGHVRLRQPPCSVPAAEEPRQPAAPAAMRLRWLRGSLRPSRSSRAQCRGFPTIAVRTAGLRRGTRRGCRQTPRWYGTTPASPDVPARCRAGGTSRRSRCRTSRGSTQPRPESSPAAGPAAPATMTAAGGSEAGERRSKAPGGRRSAGRANGRATPASVRARPDRPDPHRGGRLRPERWACRAYGAKITTGRDSVSSNIS
jgi:hypothetical protein